MIVKLPTAKTEEGKKPRGPCVPPSERVSILLELADALRMNGELVRKSALFPLFPLGAGARTGGPGEACGPGLLVLADTYSGCYMSLSSFENTPLSLAQKASVAPSTLKIKSKWDWDPPDLSLPTSLSPSEHTGCQAHHRWSCRSAGAHLPVAAGHTVVFTDCVPEEVCSVQPVRCSL